MYNILWLTELILVINHWYFTSRSLEQLNSISISGCRCILWYKIVWLHFWFSGWQIEGLGRLWWLSPHSMQKTSHVYSIVSHKIFSRYKITEKNLHMLLKLQVKLTFLRPRRMRVFRIYVIKSFECQPKFSWKQ